MPKAGVGIALLEKTISHLKECFNPFMPKAGVGILSPKEFAKRERKFQSIYAQSGRWNFCQHNYRELWMEVSIHLCPKRALESESLAFTFKGIEKFQSIYAQSGRWNKIISYFRLAQKEVSIHLCPKRALEF